MSDVVSREVLVVGAGPTGLFTALCAARAGLNLEIIDREWRIAARNYACVLHPQSLDQLDSFGLAEAVLEAGVRIDRVAFYQGQERLAEVRFEALPGRHRYAVALYQDDLEGLLEDALRDSYGHRVGWGRRLAGIQWPGQGARVVVDKLLHAPTGDSRRRWEEVVDTRSEIQAHFVVGADGPHSRLAHLLGTESEGSGDPAAFDIYEFEPANIAGPEMRVALTDRTVNTLWPLPGGTCRWSLEALPAGAEPAGLAEPSSSTLPRTTTGTDGGGGSDHAQEGRAHLLRRIQEVAPWFAAGVKELDWATRVEFPRRVAHQMGRGACWLLGDSAHQTLPGGAQSMNASFQEAAAWVDLVAKIRLGVATNAQLTELGERWRRSWRARLGLAEALDASAAVSPWVRQHAWRIMTSLPADGEALSALGSQLGLRWRP